MEWVAEERTESNGNPILLHDSTLLNESSPKEHRSVEACGYIHFVWSTLMQILVCVYLIFHVLGPSALAGLAFMIISMPITAWASARIQRDQTRMMKKKDARMSIVSEVLQGAFGGVCWCCWFNGLGLEPATTTPRYTQPRPPPHHHTITQTDNRHQDHQAVRLGA